MGGNVEGICHNLLHFFIGCKNHWVFTNGFQNTWLKMHKVMIPFSLMFHDPLFVPASGLPLLFIHPISGRKVEWNTGQRLKDSLHRWTLLVMCFTWFSSICSYQCDCDFCLCSDVKWWIQTVFSCTCPRAQTHNNYMNEWIKLMNKVN